MKLINKSRGTGKTTQLIYASAIIGFRIIAPSDARAKYIEEMAKNMGLKIPQPMSDFDYRNRKEFEHDRTPILIDEVQNQILEEALELYFGAPVVAATMSVPIDDDCVPPTPKPLVFDHETEKVRIKTNRNVFYEVFGHIKFKVIRGNHAEDRLIIQTEDGNDFRIADWLDRPYVELKEKSDERRNKS